jgi:class 3 adenylate cyclase
MRGEYIANTTTHFERATSSTSSTSAMRNELIQAADDNLLGRTPVSLIADAAGSTALMEFTPDEWLDATPLMRAFDVDPLQPRHDRKIARSARGPSLARRDGGRL